MTTKKTIPLEPIGQLLTDCESKQRYTTEADAAWEAIGTIDCRIHYCAICDGYHLEEISNERL